MPDEQPSDRRDNTVLQAVLDLGKQVNQISTELAINTNETRNIVTRLDKLNGSVAKHETAISLNEQAIALMAQTIAALQKQSDNGSAVKGEWLQWLYKGLVVLALLLAYAALVKIGIITNFLGRVIT